MPGRLEWRDAYWKRLDKETERRLRTLCPRCGSSSTYYNRQFSVWLNSLSKRVYNPCI